MYFIANLKNAHELYLCLRGYDEWMAEGKNTMAEPESSIPLPLINFCSSSSKWHKNDLQANAIDILLSSAALIETPRDTRSNKTNEKCAITRINKWNIKSRVYRNDRITWIIADWGCCCYRRYRRSRDICYLLWRAKGLNSICRNWQKEIELRVMLFFRQILVICT